MHIFTFQLVFGWCCLFFFSFSFKLSQIEQEFIIECSDAAEFPRAVSAHNLPHKVGIPIRNQKCKDWDEKSWGKDNKN